MTYFEILNFWFDDIDKSKWWIKDIDFDQLIKEKFLDIYVAASNCELYQWRQTAKGRLAEIIVLDQFPRNMFRGTARSFSTDLLALALAQEALAAGADCKLTAIQRSFLYMPFMHSESLKIHEIAVTLFRKNAAQANLDFEMKHKEIIEKFGRYPHRNKILGRPSTAAEIEFLKRPGSAF